MNKSSLLPVLGSLGLLAAGLLPSVLADTVFLKGGEIVEGEVVKETPQFVVLKLTFGTITYQRKEVSRIRKAKAPQSSGGVTTKEAAKLRDIVKLKSGETHSCLLIEASDREVIVDLIARGKNVSKTILVRTRFDPKEVVSITRLSEEERAAARRYLKEAKNEAKQEKAKMHELVLTPVDWPLLRNNKKIPALKVELDHFVIYASVKEEFLRRCATKLSRVFGAFKDHFGVDRNDDLKIKVLIFNSMEEYYVFTDRKIKNPAFYSPDRKMIVAGCNVAGYEQYVKNARKYYDKLKTQLSEYKVRIREARADIRRQVSEYNRRIFKAGKTTPQGAALFQHIRDQERKWQLALGKQENAAKKVEEEIHRLNVKNDVQFKEVTKSMFETLYHEGFHGFVDNFLFDDRRAKLVPRWMHEGLAQYFETARVEGGNMILGQVDRRRMAMLRVWGKDGSLKPISRMLGAGAEGFIVHDISNLENSTRHYLQSWLMVYWLGENKRIKKEYLQNFMDALAANKTALEALPLLSGLPNEQFQKELDKLASYDFKVKVSEPKKAGK